MRFFTIAMFVILASLTVCALDVTVKYDPLTDKVYPGETAKFRVTVTNNGRDDTFTLEKDPLGYSPFSPYFKDITINPNILIIGSKNSAEAVVEAELMDNIEPGRNYKTVLKIRSRTTGEKVDHPLTVSVLAPENPVNVDLSFPDTVMPGKEYSYKIKLRNTANLIFNPVNIYVTTNFFNKDFSNKKLYPYQELFVNDGNSEDIKFKLDPDEKAGKYPVSVSLYKGEKLVGKYTKTFEVTPNPDTEEKVSTDSRFLVRVVTVSETNKGNVVSTERYELPISRFEKFFTKFEPQPIVGETKVEWVVDVPQGETRTLTITTDYHPLFYSAIALFLVLVLVVWKAKRRISITKRVVKVKGKKGEMVALKILLHIKNNTGSKITDVRVLDVLPNVLRMSHEFGTLKPLQVQKGEKTSRIIWNIDNLEGGEERLVSYKVEPSLQLLGSLIIPRAFLKFKKSGSSKEKKSGRVVVHSEVKHKTED